MLLITIDFYRKSLINNSLCNFLARVSVGVLHWSRAYLHVQVNWVIRLRTFILALQPGFPEHTCYGVCLFHPGMAKQVELSVRCVVKGYHECSFEVNVGEIFYAFKKRGERGNAFRVTNDRGQLFMLLWKRITFSF